MKKTTATNKSTPDAKVENHLRKIRTECGLSQNDLARRVGITRQAVYSMEMNHYLPGTGVALHLAQTLGCSVEDLFHLGSEGEIIEADLVGEVPKNLSKVRAKVAWVGNRIVARPVAALGGLLNFTVPADGLILGTMRRRDISTNRHATRIYVQLLREQNAVKEQVVVAGCDPAIYLAGEHVRRRGGHASVVGWAMGSVSALRALKRKEVHVAGMHIVDPGSGLYNLPYLKKHLKGDSVTVVRFATWEQGLLFKRGNPKGIGEIGDLARKDVRIVNREKGAGARILLDYQLSAHHIPHQVVRGYNHVVFSHLDVSRLVSEGKADVGIGVRSTAGLFDLDFMPLQEERYDLVIPTAYLSLHPGMIQFLDTLVTRAFRTEVEALGGYDTREIGKIVN